MIVEDYALISGHRQATEYFNDLVAEQHSLNGISNYYGA